MSSHNDDVTTQLMFEYDQLRKEILGNSILQLQILVGTVTFVGVIMTIAFSQAVQSNLVKAAMFFAAETIAIISFIQILGLSYNAFLIASYLRIFTEDQLLHVRYETRLHKFRENRSNLPYEEITGYMRYAYAFIILVNLVLGVVHFWFWFQQNTPPSSLEYAVSAFLVSAFVVVVTLSTFMFIRVAWNMFQRFVVEHDKTFGDRWRAIKEKEKSISPENSMGEAPKK